MRTVIGVDIDDVKADFNTVLQSWHNRNYGTDFKREDITDYDLWNVWGCTREEAVRRVLQFYRSEDSKIIKPVEGSQNGCLRLRQSSDLVSITSRPFVVEEQTRAWVSNYFPRIFSGVYLMNTFSSVGHKRSKVEECKERRVKVMVEDSPQIALECYQAGIGVVLVNQPWNMSVQLPPQIIRVGDYYKADAWTNGLVEAVKRLGG